MKLDILTTGFHKRAPSSSSSSVECDRLTEPIVMSTSAGEVSTIRRREPSPNMFYESDGQCRYKTWPGTVTLKKDKEDHILRNSWCNKCGFGFQKSTQFIEHVRIEHPDAAIGPDGRYVLIKPEKPDGPIKSESEVMLKLNLEKVAMNLKSVDFVDLTNSDEEENRDTTSTADSQSLQKPSTVIVENPNTLCSPSGSEISTEPLILEHPPQQNDQPLNNEPENDRHNSMNSLEMNIGQFSLAEQYNGYNPTSGEDDIDMEVDIEEGELEEEEEEEESMPEIEFTTPTNERRKRGRKSYADRNTEESDFYDGSPTEPYTQQEKAEALRGNPAFDYRTRVNEVNGLELYAIYKCIKCPTGFPRMHHLKVHQKNHGRGAGGSYACELGCDFSTANSRLLAQHHERHQLQTNPSKFENMQSRRKKKESFNNNEKFVPSDSSSNFADNEEISNSVTNTNGQTKRRKSAHAELEKISRNLLKKKSKAAKVHRKQLKIGSCRKSNPPVDYQEQQQHEQMDTTTESINTSQEDISYNGDRYGCKECPYFTSKYDTLQRHMRGHNEQRKYGCTFCNFSSSAQDHIKKHEKCHASETKLKVSKLKIKIGTIGTNTKNGEKKKRIPATDATPEEQIRRLKQRYLQCSKCPSRFAGGANLAIHERQHGVYGKRYRCEICEYTSNRDDYFRSHQLLHMGNQHLMDENDEDFEGTEDFENENNGTTNEEGVSLNDTSVASPAPHSQSEPQSPDDPNPPTPPSVEVTIRVGGTPPPPPKEEIIQHSNHPEESYSQTYCLQSHAVDGSGHIPTSFGNPRQQNSSPLPIRPPSSSSVLSQDDEDDEVSSSEEEPSEIGKYFICSLKIANILPMGEPEDADMSKSGLVKLKGDTEEGKSSFIVSVMLGFGYDLFLGNSEKTVCGLSLKNIISKGKDFATVDLVLSLHAYPELQKEFGTHVKIQRRLTREPTPLSNVFAITPMPNGPNCKPNVSKCKVLTVKEFEGFLNKIKLSPERLRLMLIDGENITYMMENQDLWYSLFEAASMDGREVLELKLKEVDFLLSRVEDNEKSKRERIMTLKLRLEAPLPIETEQILKVKENDLMELSECEDELVGITKERQELDNKKQSFLFQLNNGTEIYVDKMLLLLNQFLNKVNYKGFIVVDKERKALRICAQKLGSKDPAPVSIEEVDYIWMNMSTGKRRLAVIGLYMGLWDISNYLQVFAADAYSCTETEFRVPLAGLPVLWDLMNNKCLERKQSIISLPPDY